MLLTRSATNTYYPQVAMVISLPQADDELTRRVGEFMKDLHEVSGSADVAMARKFNAELRARLAGYGDDDVFDCVQRLLASPGDGQAADPRIAEFDVLASGRPVIGQNRRDAHLHAETLPRSAWDPGDDTLVAGIADLVAVHRLREVSCIYGFTRFDPAPTADDELEDIGLAVSGAPLGIDPEWLPAIEQFGEGLFLRFKRRRWRAGLARKGRRSGWSS